MVLALAIAELIPPASAEIQPPRPTVQRALTRFWRRYAGGRDVGEHRFLVLWRLRACRTAQLGGYRLSCPDCDEHVYLYQSCHDRHCPTCQGPRRHAWAEKMSRLLLPVPHYQVVFTLPDVLWPIYRQFPAELYVVHLKAAAETVLELAERRWGATPSVLSVLHTWNRRLEFYPHVHCVVSAGGLREDGTWYAHGTTFLWDRKSLGRLFRGKFLAKLRDLDLPLSPEARVALKEARSRSMETEWYTYVEKPQGRPSEHVLRYLAQYVHGIAISDHRILAMDDATVTFRVRGEETLTLPGEEFVRRFALHVLPKGFRKTRTSGLLGSSCRARLEAARRAVSRVAVPEPTEGPVVAEEVDEEQEDDALGLVVLAVDGRDRCPHCQRPWTRAAVPPDRDHLRGPP